MTYALGVDLGTTWSAAAVARGAHATIVELGNRTAAMPSVVFLTEEGKMLTGEAANRRGIMAPDRVAREFKRRIGSETSLLIGTTPTSAESLTARLLRSIVAAVTEVEGDAPSSIVVTHPANWGEYKLDLQRQAFRMAGLDVVSEITEPEAAAMHYASLEHTPEGSPIGVFDLGGGTFDAAVLRKQANGFEILGAPDGVERLGGIDFDEAVFAHVKRSLGGAFEDLDLTDPNVIGSVSRLRSECVAAKEALSKDTDVSIPVILPALQTEVRITRSEFEGMIRPSLSDAVDAFERSVRSAGLSFSDLHRVLLIGGSSRIPLVGQVLGGEMGLPISINAHPKHAVALGAALRAHESTTEAVVAAVEQAPEPTALMPAAVAAAPPVTARPPVTATPPIAQPEPVAAVLGAATHADPVPQGKSKLPWILAVAVCVLAAIGAIVILTGGGSAETAVDQPVFVNVDDDEQPNVRETASVVPAPTAVTVEPTPTAPVPTATSIAPTPTPPPTPTEVPVFACQAGLCTHIEAVTEENGELIIEWTSHGFTPSVANFHAHFFYDIYEARQVGSNFVQFGAVSQGSWQVTDVQPFRTAGSVVSIANAPAQATAICVVAADSGHGVANPENAECVSIPGR